MSKFLLCTSSSDNFAAGTAIMIYSMKKHMSTFKRCDVKVFYNVLSQSSKDLILAAHHEVKFEKPLDTKYCAGSKTIYGEGNQDVYLCLESFRFNKYRKVLCFDSDMLCIGDISDMLLQDLDFGGCHKGNENKRWGRNQNDNFVGLSNKYYQINGGLFVIGPRYLGMNTYDAIRHIVRTKTHKHKSADQTTINAFFQEQIKPRVYMFPDEYNFRYWGGGGMGTDELAAEMWPAIKNIHYSGRRKPWADESKSTEDMCSISYIEKTVNSLAYKVWHKYHEECFGEKYGNGPQNYK